MAVALMIDSVDRIADLHVDTLKIEQVAGAHVATCSFKLDDESAVLSISGKDPVVITDGGTTLFAGEVADVDWDPLALNLEGRKITVTCQDYGILVEETVIDGYEAHLGEADSDIIAELFAVHRPDIDASTYVSTLKASMSIVSEDTTLRQALDKICSITGGIWYIDEDKALHYFEAESNTAAWSLSDTPNESTTFGYERIARRDRGGTIVNRILVIGYEDLRAWREDAASIASYGERSAVTKNTQITTLDDLEAYGDAILAEWADPKVRYEITTRKEGLRAGMDVRLICGAWSVDETLTVRRLTIRWSGNVRFYDLELGDVEASAVTGLLFISDCLYQVVSDVGDLDDVVFDVDGPAAPDLQTGNLSTGVNIQGDGTQLVYLVVTWGSVGDSDLNQYEVQISTASDFSANVQTRLHAADGDREERWEGLMGGTTYYVRVRALDWVGNPSAWSTTRNITSSTDSSAPAQVTGAVAAGARTIIGLDWDDNSDADRAAYEVQRSPNGSSSWATIATVRSSHHIDENFSEAEIQAGTTFYYRVRCVDTSENPGTWSSTVNAALNPLGSDSIAALSIIAGKIAAGAVETDKLAALGVTTEKLAAGAATVEKLDVVVGGYNLLLNSGMNDDDDGDGVPDEWTVFGNGSDWTSILDTSGKIVGVASHRITAGGGDLDTEYNLYYQDVTLANVPLAIGDDFVLSGYISSSAVIDIQGVLLVQWLDAGSGVLQTDQAAQVTTDIPWTRFTVTNTVPAGAVTARVVYHVQLTDDAGSGYFWFDAIKLEQGDVPTSWTTGMIGHVTIDANRVQVTDSDAKVWLGKRGAVLGLFGEDSSGNLQVYIDASDGRLYAAAGTVTMSADGIEIEVDTLWIDKQSYQFVNSGVIVSQLVGYLSDTQNFIILQANDISDHESIMHLASYSPSGQVVQAQLWAAQIGTTNTAIVSCDVDAGGVAAVTVQIGTPTGPVSKLEIGSDDVYAPDNLRTAAAVLIGDGITAPGATAGYATIYVDKADGDLKVKFADGVTKTLATDT